MDRKLVRVKILRLKEQTVGMATYLDACDFAMTESRDWWWKE